MKRSKSPRPDSAQDQHNEMLENLDLDKLKPNAALLKSLLPSPETSDPMQPAMGAVEDWSHHNSDLLEAGNQDDPANSATEPQSSQDEMVVLTPDLLEASRRLGELFKRQGLFSHDTSDSDQSFLDSNLKLFKGDDPLPLDDELPKSSQPGPVQ